MTSATDNRTTELREMLTERGVDYVIVDFGDASNVLTWVSSDAAWYYVEEQQRLFGESVTPEQAVAATLGADDGSRWFELFGTPERAAETMKKLDQLVCQDCLCVDSCEGEDHGCYYESDEKMLEWLRGKAVHK